MAESFFAGVPVDGSGARPLDADLYSAQQQGVDAENISATGNLNIGNVIQYDEHAQRTMIGGAARADGQNLADLDHAPTNPVLIATGDGAPPLRQDPGGDTSIRSGYGGGEPQTIAPAAPAPAPSPSVSQTIVGNTDNAGSNVNSPQTTTSQYVANSSETSSYSHNGGNTYIQETNNYNESSSYTENTVNNYSGGSSNNQIITINNTTTNSSNNSTTNNYGGNGGQSGDNCGPGQQGHGGNLLSGIEHMTIALANGADQLLDHALTVVTAAPSALLQQVDILVNNVAGQTGNLLGETNGLLSQSVANAGATASGLLTQVAGDANGLLTNGGGAVATVLNGAENNLGGAVNAATGTISAGLSAGTLNIENTLSNQGGGVSAGLGNLLGNVAGGADAAVAPVMTAALANSDGLTVTALNGASAAIGGLSSLVEGGVAINPQGGGINILNNNTLDLLNGNQLNTGLTAANNLLDNDNGHLNIIGGVLDHAGLGDIQASIAPVIGSVASHDGIGAGALSDAGHLTATMAAPIAADAGGLATGLLNGSDIGNLTGSLTSGALAANLDHLAGVAIDPVTGITVPSVSDIGGDLGALTGNPVAATGDLLAGAQEAQPALGLDNALKNDSGSIGAGLDHTLTDMGVGVAGAAVDNATLNLADNTAPIIANPIGNPTMAIGDLVAGTQNGQPAAGLDNALSHDTGPVGAALDHTLTDLGVGTIGAALDTATTSVMNAAAPAVANIDNTADHAISSVLSPGVDIPVPSVPSVPVVSSIMDIAAGAAAPIVSTASTDIHDVAAMATSLAGGAIGAVDGGALFSAAAAATSAAAGGADTAHGAPAATHIDTVLHHLV